MNTPKVKYKNFVKGNHLRSKNHAKKNILCR